MSNKINRRHRYLIPFIFLVTGLLQLIAEDVKKRNGDSDNSKDLIKVCFKLEVDEIRSLLDKGVDVNSQNPENTGNREFIDPWTLGYQQNTSGWNALIALANSNRFPDPDFPVGNSETERQKAFSIMTNIPNSVIADRNVRRILVAQALIEAGCDVNQIDETGNSALSYSLRNGYDDLALLLADKGADVKLRVNDSFDGPGNRFIIHMAVGHPQALAAVILLGANVNSRDDEGNTPLHEAARYSDLTCVKLLIDSKACIHTKNNASKTALDVVGINSVIPSEANFVRQLLSDKLENSKVPGE